MVISLSLSEIELAITALLTLQQQEKQRTDNISRITRLVDRLELISGVARP